VISKEKFAILSGSAVSELDEAWDKSSQLAHHMVVRLPYTGFFSMEKRVAAFEVIADEVQEAIDSEKVSMNDAIMATVIAKLSDRRFKRTFETYIVAGNSGRINYGNVNRFSTELFRAHYY